MSQSLPPNLATVVGDVDVPWESPEVFLSVCRAHLERATGIRAWVAADGGAVSGETTIESLNALSQDLDVAGGWAALMFAVHPKAALREAAQQCQQEISALAHSIQMDRRLYEALLAIDLTEVEADCRRVVTKSLRDFRRVGVDRDDMTRARLKEIHKELTVLKQDFGKHIREDQRAITLSEVSQLEGLPTDYVERHPPNEDGDIRITTDYPDFFPFQTFARDGALRKALYEAYLGRAYPANVTILHQVLNLRHEYATLLGYESWAAYNAEDKMAKSASTIEDFVQELVAIVKSVSARDLKQLLARKQQDDPEAQSIQSWDRLYYTNLVREASYGLDAQELRSYFPFDAVKDGVLSLYAELFDLEIKRLPDAPVWHESVQAYALMERGEVVGNFFLDCHPRTGKFKHAAVFPVRTGLQDGPVPIAALVTNFTEPTADDHGLMEHSQVVTFLHEFGHLMHHLLARRSRWVSLGGIHVEWDFVEVPSQLFEEWAWDWSVLRRFAVNPQTGESIPEKLVARMRGANEFGKGVHVMRQLFLTAYSFYLHSRDPSSLDLESFTAEMTARYSPYPALPGGHLYASFGHLMGYSSMYYTYQWSLVIAKDLFSRFGADKLLDRETATALKEHILAPGGARDAAVLVEDFLGRPYNFDAYRRWLEAS